MVLNNDVVHTNHPAQTIITFDLHGVVSILDYKVVAGLVIRNPICILKLCWYTFNPFFLRDVYRLWRMHAVAASYLELVRKKYPFLSSTIPFLLCVGNAQVRNQQLIDLIIRMKSCGYTVHLFSNIGDFIMDDFQKLYPDVVALFDQVHITHKEDNYVGKPYDQAFVSYQQRCNPEGKRVIFVDNSKRNIDACARYAMTGIHFKNTSQVASQLSSLLYLEK